MVNAFHLAESRGIAVRLETMGQAVQRAIQHSIELEITEKQDGETKTHTIIGTVFADNQPRVRGIKGYWMDMIPAGPMVLIVNKVKPGVIGLGRVDEVRLGPGEPEHDGADGAVPPPGGAE